MTYRTAGLATLVALTVGAVLVAGSTRALTAPAANPHPFTVVVTVDPATQAKLERMKEGIRVLAMYSGEPIPAKAKHANEVGEIALGEETIELPASGGTANFTGMVRTDRWTWVREPQVLINASSAFRATRDNILDCGTVPFQDSFKVAQSKPIMQHCKMLK